MSISDIGNKLANGGGFYSFKLRDLLEFIVIIGMGVGFLITRTEREVSSDKAIQAVIEQQASINAEQDRRIGVLEQELSGLIPDVREVKTKVSLVADLLSKDKK